MNPGKLSDRYMIYARTKSQDTLGESVYTYAQAGELFGTPLADGSEDRTDALGGERIRRLVEITVRTEALESFDLGDELEDRFGRRWTVRLKILGVRYSKVSLSLFDE